MDEMKKIDKFRVDGSKKINIKEYQKVEELSKLDEKKATLKMEENKEKNCCDNKLHEKCCDGSIHGCCSKKHQGPGSAPGLFSLSHSSPLLRQRPSGRPPRQWPG